MPDVEAQSSSILIHNMPEPNSRAKPDTGMRALRIIARYHQTEISVPGLSHQIGLGSSRATASDILRAADIVGFDGQLISKDHNLDLSAIPRPAILQFKNGDFVVLNKRLPSGVEKLRHPLVSGPLHAREAEITKHWTGDAIIIRPRVVQIDGEQSKEAEFGLRWFIAAAARYRKSLIHVLIASCFVQLFSLVTPVFFQVIVDKVLVHRSVQTLEVIVFGLIVVGLFDVILQYLRSYALFHTATRIDVDLGVKIFSALFRLPLSYFETRPTGQTVARVREVETIRAFLTGQALTSIIDGVFAIIYVFVLLYYSGKLTLVVLCALPLYVSVAAVVRPRLRERVKEKFNRGAYSQQFLVESVVGAATLKAAAVEPLLQKQWEERLVAYVQAAFRVVTLGTVGQVSIQYVSKLTTALILFFGAGEVIAGNMSVGQLVAFNMVSNQLVAPLLRLSQFWQDIQQIQVSVERLGDILNAEPEDHTGATGRIPQQGIGGNISLENVSFRYKPSLPYAVSNLSLAIPAGQVLGVVGESGSGKSTLAKLIQRMYVPENGRVTIDSTNIAHIHPAWFRRQIGVVLQENVLFNRTIHENIALSNPGMSRSKVVEVAKLAGADEFIARMPDGYDSRLEERGANLSGGQRQRIAIARALARNPKVLIFDEATSALDYESEFIIQQNMSEIVRGRTVIIIAHRLAAVRNCHRIISMLNGKIMEDGTHDDLVRIAGGIYSGLWALQSGTRG